MVWKRLDEIENVDCQPRTFVFRNELFNLRVRPDGFFNHALLLQHFGGVFEAFVLQQLVDEFLAGVASSGEMFVQFRIARQQHFALDVDERGGHVDEVGTEFNIERGRLFHVLQILRGDLGDRDVFEC